MFFYVNCGRSKRTSGLKPVLVLLAWIRRWALSHLRLKKFGSLGAHVARRPANLLHGAAACGFASSAPPFCALTTSPEMSLARRVERYRAGLAPMVEAIHESMHDKPPAASVVKFDVEVPVPFGALPLSGTSTTHVACFDRGPVFRCGN